MRECVCSQATQIEDKIYQHRSLCYVAFLNKVLQEMRSASRHHVMVRLFLFVFIYGIAGAAACTLFLTRLMDPWINAPLLWLFLAILLLIYVETFLTTGRLGLAFHRFMLALKLLSAGVITVIWFAGVYRFLGMTELRGSAISGQSEALYLSLITWSTVGYGDIMPNAASRPFAAAEGILGYLYLAIMGGLTVALAIRNFSDSSLYAGNKPFSTRSSDRMNEDGVSHLGDMDSKTLFSAYKEQGAGFRLPKK